MEEEATIHGFTEGDVVEVTEVTVSKMMNVGRDDPVNEIQENVRYEIRSINEPIRGSKYTLSLHPLDGQEVPSYKTAVVSTYESWAESENSDYLFDADGHTTNYANKYFNCEKV